MTIDRRTFFSLAGGAIAGASAHDGDAASSAPANCCGLTVNVRAAPYSAKGDGRTNDTAAITAAVNAVAGNVVRGPLEIAEAAELADDGAD